MRIKVFDPTLLTYCISLIKILTTLLYFQLQLTKLLEGLYASKILADAVDDAADNDRQTACEFVYDYMLNTYGLKGLAESAVHGVFKKIKQMIIGKGIDKCHKVGLLPP